MKPKANFYPGKNRQIMHCSPYFQKHFKKIKQRCDCKSPEWESNSRLRKLVGSGTRTDQNEIGTLYMSVITNLVIDKKIVDCGTGSVQMKLFPVQERQNFTLLAFLAGTEN